MSPTAQIESTATALPDVRFPPASDTAVAEGGSAGWRQNSRGIKLCHFSTAHTELKSRSFHRQCVPLAAAGFEIVYVSPCPLEERQGAIEFVRLPQKRGFQHPLGQAMLLRILLKQHADLYHFQDPQLLPLALVLKLVFGKRVIYDAYEDFPSMAAQKASLPRFARPLAGKLIATLESTAARCFDAVTTADPFTLRRIARTGRSRKAVFYNFPNVDFFPPPDRRTKTFDLVYRGGLSERAGTFLLLEALRMLAARGRHVSLLLIGYTDGPAADQQLRERITKAGLDPQVTVRGRIPHEDMDAALSKARIGISPLQDTPKFRLNIPVKLFEYWACGLPVISTDLPPVRPFMRGSDAGLLVPPGDCTALASGIAWLLDNPIEAAQMGSRGRAMVDQRLNNAPEVRKFAKLCAKIAGEPLPVHARGLQNA